MEQWTDAQTYRLMVALVSVVVLVRIAGVAGRLRQQGSETSEKISAMMFGTCVEIGFATVAVFLPSYLLLWTTLRVVGRLIEWAMVERFSRYLYQRRANGGQKEN
jgi:hypothetical protein